MAGGLLVTLGIVAVTYWLDTSRKQKNLLRPPELPQNVKQQLSGFTFTRSDGGQRVFTIHAARTLAMKQGGTTLLKDVDVEFYGHSGKRFDVLRTAQGVYDPVTNNLSIPGDAELILNAPKQLSLAGGVPAGNEEMLSEAASNPHSVFIKTSKVTSRDHSNLVESGTAVRFRLGDVMGSAVGLSYDAGKGQIVLDHEVKAVFQPAQKQHGEPPIHLSSSNLRYDDSGKKAELSGPVEVRQGDRVIKAKQGHVTLSPRNRIAEIRLDGKVRATAHSPRQKYILDADLLKGQLDPETGALRKLVANGHVRGESREDGTVAILEGHEAQMNFSGPSQIPVGGKVMGQVRLTFAQPKRPKNFSAQSAAFSAKVSREELATDALRFAFHRGGKSLRDAETLGPGTITLTPESPKEGWRKATANRFSMVFDRQSHLKTLNGDGGTQITFAAPPGASNQNPSVASAQRLLAVFDPGTETLRSVEQWGDFRFQNGEMHAEAEKAHDSMPEQVLVLSGHPKVWDQTTRTQADQIILKVDSGSAEGIGHVQSVHFETQKGSSLPTNVVADRMTADRNAQVVHYEGHVRAWRGTDVLESASLDVYKNQGRLSSNSRVVTSHLQSPSLPASGHGKGGGFGSHSITIAADRLDYFDSGHKALYTGHVAMDTEDSLLQADRLEVYFASSGSQSGSQIERAVATGHVLVTQPRRYAKGDRATYDAKLGKIVMTGGPPRLYDAQKGFTSGQRLTFFTHNDRLLVDGSRTSPSVSKHQVAQ